MPPNRQAQNQQSYGNDRYGEGDNHYDYDSHYESHYDSEYPRQYPYEVPFEINRPNQASIGTSGNNQRVKSDDYYYEQDSQTKPRQNKHQPQKEVRQPVRTFDDLCLKYPEIERDTLLSIFEQSKKNVDTADFHLKEMRLESQSLFQKKDPGWHEEQQDELSVRPVAFDKHRSKEESTGDSDELVMSRNISEDSWGGYKRSEMDSMEERELISEYEHSRQKAMGCMPTASELQEIVGVIREGQKARTTKDEEFLATLFLNDTLLLQNYIVSEYEKSKVSLDNTKSGEKKVNIHSKSEFPSLVSQSNKGRRRLQEEWREESDKGDGEDEKREREQLQGEGPGQRQCARRGVPAESGLQNG